VLRAQFAEIRSRLRAGGATRPRSELVRLSTRAATLDDVFLALTGRSLTEAEQG